jgi:lipopolysaccharide transport system ATP-binding protein
MRKAEIKRKFDEIVDFAGVERYINTPVKRYSSGMYVRLAFAVAAHLEAEILVVDEVLAVGDAEFQRKCIGKMGDVSKGEGKTVLFVSHNMGSVRQLCNKGILLSNGELIYMGHTETTIKNYMGNAISGKLGIHAIGTLTETIKIKTVMVNGIPLDAVIAPKDTIEVCIQYECVQMLLAFRISCTFLKDGITVLTIQDLEDCEPIAPGRYQSTIRLPAYFLRPGVYNVSVGGHNANHTNFSIGKVEWLFATDVSSFEILEDWDEIYDFNNNGLINLPNNSGSRITLEPA